MSLGEVHTIPKRNNLVVEWRISDFFSRSDIFYNSPAFSFNGESWLLGIYPKGASWNKSVGYINLRLGTLRRSMSPINFEYSLSLKTSNGIKYREKTCTNVFDIWRRYECVRFIPRSELRSRRSELVPPGVLTVICTLKSRESSKNTINEEAGKLSENDEEITSNANAGTKVLTKRKRIVPAVNDDESQDSSTSEEVPEGVNRAVKALIRSCQKLSDVDETGECKASSSNHTDTGTSTESDDGSLSQDFKRVLLEGLNHDLILEVGDFEFRAHQDILRARSPVFKSTLSHVQEKKNCRVVIHDCDPLAMEQFLSYIYSGKFEVLDQSQMLQMYYIANKYEVTGLKKDCFSFIKKSLSPTNICEVLRMAVKRNDPYLLESATEHFISNATDIMRTEEWKMFMKDNFKVANDLLIKSFDKKK